MGAKVLLHFMLPEPAAFIFIAVVLYLWELFHIVLQCPFISSSFKFIDEKEKNAL